MKSNNTHKIQRYCYTALLASMIFVATTYLPHVPIGIGYVHMGDALVFLAASLLPAPFAVFAAAVGASLADLISGAPVWIPATFLIKGLTVLCFTYRAKKIINSRNILALIPALILCCGGYYLYESIILGNFIAPLSYIIPNALQTIVSAILYLLLAALIDRAPKLKNQMMI